MRCVVQRVSKASVRVNGDVIGRISVGFVAFIGIGSEDSREDIDWLAEKIAGLRVFEDQDGKMNLSLAEVGGEILLISQFTLFGDCRKGKRPSFSHAAPPQQAKEIFDQLVNTIKSLGIHVETGQFQADMDVELVNQGPVTILLDSKKNF
ncbi:MAG: D-tyrosyl-tRNA(Tyr) deacylase [Peptococcaceae bacterium]|nr:D-tyrosyl-tRNA(Tyr) deacylase [Peptococcaceae bacterium]